MKAGLERAERALLFLALIASLVAAPNVTLVSPANGGSVIGPAVTFIFQANGSAALLNATLFTNFTGSVAPNASTTSVGNNTNTSFVVTGVSAGTYGWNVLVYENTTPASSATGPVNFTVLVLAPTPTPTPTVTPSPTAQPSPIPSPQCTSLFSVEVLASANVTQGVTASYPIVVRNNAGTSQTVSLAAVCDPRTLTCTLNDVPFPNTLSPGEQRTHHLLVDTSQAPAGRYNLVLEVSGGTTTDSCTDRANLVLDVQPRTTTASQSSVVSGYLAPSEALLGTPGEVVEYTLGLVNTGSQRTIVDLSAPGNPLAESTLFEAVQVSLSPGETRALRVRVTLPAGVPGGDYTWPFVARWMTAAQGPYDIVLPARLRVLAPTLALQLVPEPALDCLMVSGDKPGLVETNVRNNGNGRATLVASIDAPESTKRIVKVVPEVFELKTGESARVQITIKPQRTTTLGIHHYRLVLKNLDYALVDRSLCAEVASVANVQVESFPLEVLRARTKTYGVTIKNLGNTFGKYALEVSAPAGVIATTDPTTLDINPGLALKADLVLQTSLRTPLGPGKITLTVRPQTGDAVSAEFPLNVLASNQSGESYLRLEGAPVLEVVAGIEKKFELDVTNTAPVMLPQVTLALLGVPATWYESVPRDIPAGQTARLTLNVHARSPEKDLYPIRVALASGLESVHYPTTLGVAPAVKRLEVSNLSSQPIREGGVTREVLVSVSLRNTGNTPASDVRPVLFSSGGEIEDEIFAVPEEAVQLQPGEERTVRFHVKPASAQTSEKTTTLKLASAEGAQATRELKVPSLQSKPAGGGGLPWAAVIIVVLLLIGVFAYLARQEYGFARTPPREVKPSELEQGEAGRVERRKEFLQKREQQLLENQKMLKYRYLKRELDELTFKRLWDESGVELAQVKGELKEIGNTG